MSDDTAWTAPGADAAREGAPPPTTQPTPPDAQSAPPPPPQHGPPPPAQYGQQPPQQYAPPPPQQYAPPPPPQYGQQPPQQYAPPPPPQYGQQPPQQYAAAPQAGQQAPEYAAYPPPQYAAYPPPQVQAPYGQPSYGTPAYALYGAQVTAAAAPEGWTPPPKPGLIPLRPLGFGTLLGAPFQVLRRNPKATIGSGLIVQAAIIVLTVLLVGGVTFWIASRYQNVAPEDEALINAGSWAIGILAALFTAALSLFLSAVLQAVLVLEVARGTLGEKRRLGELWKAAFRRILPLMGWLAVLFVAVVIAFGLIVGVIALGSLTGNGAGIAVGILVSVLLALGLAVLGAWLGTKTSMVPSIIVLERKGVFAAIGRSWRLTRGNFWRTFGTIALVYVILQFASQILTTPFSLVIGFVPTLIDPTGTGSGIIAVIVVYFVFLAFTVIIGAITSVVQAAVVAVIYIDLRMRKEGLDVELTRFVESVHTDEDGRWPDPYLPRAAA